MKIIHFNYFHLKVWIIWNYFNSKISICFSKTFHKTQKIHKIPQNFKTKIFLFNWIFEKNVNENLDVSENSKILIFRTTNLIFK